MVFLPYSQVYNLVQLVASVSMGDLVAAVMKEDVRDVRALAEIPHFDRSFVDTRKDCGRCE